MGATVPWTTYEAENMVTTGNAAGPDYTPGLSGVEASGRHYVQLYSANQFVEFTASAPANAMVVRYSVPDTSDGVGADYTLSLYTNGVFARKLPLTSRYSWLYGYYPFSNDPSLGQARNLYDEVRLMNLSISPGDTVRLQKDASDTASYYNLDLVDLENVAPPGTQPSNSLSVTSYGADTAGVTNATTAFVNCIAAANTQQKSVWIPPGTYKITASLNLPANLTIQGAGMWHTTLMGDPSVYNNASSRVALNGTGSQIHISDLAIVGKLNYRNDSEPNDGIGGSYGVGSTISRVWVEHTKTGAWIVNSSGLVVDNCRFRDTIADGINTVVGMRGTLVTNCTARGTGDDCFAMWPATYQSQTYIPGLNTFSHCTGQLPFLANCGAIYGGTNNTIEDCLFQDSCYGCGVLISTTFPVGANVFSGTTTVRRCTLNRCAGEDPSGSLNGAFVLYPNNSRLSGINVNNVTILNSLADAFDVIAPGSDPSSGIGTLSNSILSYVTIPNYGLGFFGSDALRADSSALGSLTVSNSAIVEYNNLSTHFTFNFVTNPVPILSFSGNPAFNGVPIGISSNINVSIGNFGGSVLTISNLSCPPGFSGAFSGQLSPGAVTNIPITFSPARATNYNGDITITSDAAGGINSLAASGTGFVLSNLLQKIIPQPDGSAMLTCSTMRGFSYHLEVTTNLNPPAWIPVPGTGTNAIGAFVTFVDPNPDKNHSRFYRSVSP